MDITASHTVARDFDTAAEVFAGAPSQWLPVIVGPEEESWRAEAREGPIGVRVVVTAGRVVVREDGVRWRSFTVRPDPTDRTAFVTAWLTPSVVGDLGLAPAADGTAELRFEGATESRSWMTTWLERTLVGDRLSHSAIDTLLGQMAARLAMASTGDEEGEVGPSHTYIGTQPTDR